jgi:hypothetical protein
MRTLLTFLADARGFSHRAVFQAFAEGLAKIITRRRGSPEARVRIVNE